MAGKTQKKLFGSPKKVVDEHKMPPQVPKMKAAAPKKSKRGY